MAGFKFQDEHPQPSSKLIFISDTQEPRRGEELFLSNDNNREATRVLLADIQKQNPSELFFLGDVVNLSRQQKRWTGIDSCLVMFTESGIPYHACLGNHELMGNSRLGEANFQERFPDHVNTGYVVLSDSIATVFLNSNFSKMSSTQLKKQNDWYSGKLKELDSMNEVKIIIVCCHHSPYSASKLVGSSYGVQENFVKPFLKYKKCRMFVSGHAHLFQHFKIQGRDFLVIGGGGGLRHPMKKGGIDQKDLASDYKPEFHYLEVLRFGNRLEVISRKLNKDFTGTEEGNRFEIKLED